MHFLKKIKRRKCFSKDENGAVTVDWVVLSAAAIGFGFLVFTVFAPQFYSAMSGLQSTFTNATTGP